MEELQALVEELLKRVEQLEQDIAELKEFKPQESGRIGA
jgi:archaellum component FlaC